MRILPTILCIICILFFSTAYASQEGYWDDAAQLSVNCIEDHDGCLVLQMVLLGSFSEVDTGDNLSKRVLSAALSPLCGVTDEDIVHFCGEFGEDEALVRELYYIALGNCLWADILLNPAEGSRAAARTIMLLFLDPDSMVNSDQQMELIRASLDEEDCVIIAEASGLPLRFVKYLLTGDDALDAEMVEELAEFEDERDDIDEEMDDVVEDVNEAIGRVPARVTPVPTATAVPAATIAATAAPDKAPAATATAAPANTPATTATAAPANTPAAMPSTTPQPTDDDDYDDTDDNNDDDQDDTDDQDDNDD